MGLNVLDAPAGELVRRARNQDAAAWAELVARYSGLLWTVARSYGLGEADAADVVQTSWLRLVEHLDRIREADAIGGWLAVTARRECERTLRRRAVPMPVQALPDPAPGPEQVAAERDRLSRVAAALREMPRRCRNLLRLLACSAGPEQISYAEIADMLGIPVGGIGPTRARCLTDLRRRLSAGPSGASGATGPSGAAGPGHLAGRR